MKKNIAQQFAEKREDREKFEAFKAEYLSAHKTTAKKFNSLVFAVNSLEQQAEEIRRAIAAAKRGDEMAAHGPAGVGPNGLPMYYAERFQTLEAPEYLAYIEAQREEMAAKVAKIVDKIRKEYAKAATAETAEETTEATAETAEETTEATAETAEETTEATAEAEAAEATAEAEAEAAEATAETAEETTEATAETAEETTEATAEAAAEALAISCGPVRPNGWRSWRPCSVRRSPIVLTRSRIDAAGQRVQDTTPGVRGHTGAAGGLYGDALRHCANLRKVESS